MADFTTPSIPEYFTGKNIFMTGGTGFIGKVLIEKVLRSCPDVGKIYLLIRPKKGKSAEERMQEITDVPLFDKLKEKYPENLKKLVPILGDVVELDLGLNPDDRKLLIKEVNIVYHIAASVRFDDSLRHAVIMNVRGTREVIGLCKGMQNLDVLVHFSTTYCHTDKKTVDEIIYPPHADWQKTIEIVEKGDPFTLQVMGEKIIKPHPNTYTFSKSLAETVVQDLCDGQVPTVIFRPSIVISTMLDPFCGWIDNMNGPVSSTIASGKGVLRTMYADPNAIADYIPCDLVVKATIIATWKKGIERSEEKYMLNVYNGSSNKLTRTTMNEAMHIGRTISWDNPIAEIFWYPDGVVTKCWYYFYVRFVVYQLLPALFADALLRLFRKKTILLKVQRRILIGISATCYFLCNEWTFINRKASALENQLNPSDVESFSYQRDHKLTDSFNYFAAALVGGKKYLLKEDESKQFQTKKNALRSVIERTSRKEDRELVHEMKQDLIPTIPEYFSGKNIFVTGGTGFIGKVLIEKILRSCPEVGKVYVLIRPKRGKRDPRADKGHHRLAGWRLVVESVYRVKSKLFDRLKVEHPENLQKILPVLGDVTKIGLGKHKSRRQINLIDEVNLVYHIAASVRFDDLLKDAVFMNTRATREVVLLSKQMKRLDVFAHFSTTYCNTDRPVVEEKIYPPHADWRETIELGEDKYKLDVYNGSSNKIKYVTMGGLVEMGKKLCWETPLNNILWYPDGSITNCWYHNYFKVIFYQLLPALFIDGLLLLLKMKPLEKIYIANTALGPYVMNEWTFVNTKAFALDSAMLPSDKDAFSYQTEHELSDPFKFFTAGLMGARRYLLKEPDSTMEEAKRHSRRMWLIAQFCNGLWLLFGIWMVYKLVLVLLTKVDDVYVFLNH
ncbi:hypothetical protein NQ317_002664 [Molorchus minor]|uniref:Fatty acyl-CoA reductase n=1 Tax=Molorchus minor TaxID=1323400 RepID=A0ABQ9JJI1_9CUCU|nr:hypothetical protein NQ317_002664 [Molorchus minor]